MKSDEERKAAFMRDLRNLLAFHSASITVDTRSVGNWSVEAEACVELESVFDADGDMLEAYTLFNLPRYMDGKEQGR